MEKLTREDDSGARGSSFSFAARSRRAWASGIGGGIISVPKDEYLLYGQYKGDVYLAEMPFRGAF